MPPLLANSEFWLAQQPRRPPTGHSQVLQEIGHPRVAGTLGSASALKLALMSAIIPAVLAVGEALKVGRSLGLTDESVVQALAASPMAAPTNKTMSQTAHYPVRLAAKDLALVEPSPERSIGMAALAAVRDGRGDLDLGAFARSDAK